MPITFTTQQPKRFETGRPGKMHFLTGNTGGYIATQKWIDNDPHTDSLGTNLDFAPTGADRMGVTDHPIAYIKAIANEALHGGGTSSGSGDAFYDERVTLAIGTMDETIAGTGWVKIPAGTETTIKDCWYRYIYMDEADHLDGNFDYVEVQDLADGCGVLAYEYNY